MLELSDWVFRTMIKMLMDLMDKVLIHSMQEQMGNIRRDSKTEPKKCQRSKTLIELKNTFGKLISILDMAEERISELDISVKTTKTEKQREKRLGEKSKQEYQEMRHNYKRSNTCVMGIPERKKQKKYLK